MVTTQADIPDGERMVKLETNVETLMRDMSETRTDIRELRSDVKALQSTVDQKTSAIQDKVDQKTSAIQDKSDRQYQWLVAIMIGMWVTIVVGVVVALLANS